VTLGTAAAAIVILIAGSYAGHWTWTGLTQNGQVWDWMQLLLLPVAIGTFPLWLRFSGEMSPVRRRALAGAVIAFAAFVLVGYLVPLGWTGFRGHTLWNWLTLIVLPMTSPPLRCGRRRAGLSAPRMVSSQERLAPHGS